MNKDLQSLIALAEIDKEASKLEPQITEINNELNEKTKLLTKTQDELESLQNSAKRAKVDISANELIIQENSEKIEQIDKKMATIKSEQEIRALDAENGLAKEKIAYANERISHIEKELSSFAGKEEAVQNKIKDLEKEIEKCQEDVQKKTAKVKAELKKIFDSKEKIAKNIDNKVLIFYEKIRKWAKDTSIVVVKKQACSGCYIRINDMIYSELLKSDDIITCPHCGRILYIAQ